MGYAGGALALLVVLAATVLTASALRSVVVPGWTGPEARLAEALLAVSTLVAESTGLGLVGALRRGPVLLTALAVAAGASVVRRRQRRDPGPAPSPVPALSGRGARAAAVLSVAAVASQWLQAVRSASLTGVQAFDALHYHLPRAAAFARTGSVLGLPRLEALGITTWYPFDDELLQGLGMVLLGTDALTLVLPLVSLGAVLLSAWCLAAPYGAGPAAVVGTCVLLATFGPTYAGSAGNDWAATWPLLAAIALVVQARRRGPDLPLGVVALTGLAGGLAVGTKLTVLAPAAGLLVAVVVLARRRRAAALGTSLSTHLLTGGLWYVHDLAVTGSPLPLARLGAGPLRLPRPDLAVLDRGSASVLHYLGDPHVVSRYLLAGLRSALGPGWPLLVLLVLTGLVLAVAAGRPPDGVLRAGGLVGALAAVAYLATPTSAAGRPGQPVLFAANVRYALVALLLGLVLLAVTAGRRGRGDAAAVALLVPLALVLLRPGAWVRGWRSGAVAVLLLIAAGALVLVARRHGSRRPPARRAAAATGLVLACVAALAAAPPLERAYEDGRYAGRAGPRDALFAAVARLDVQRIGVVGFPLQYPLLGPRRERDVSYVGQERPGHSYADLGSCATFFQEVARRRLDLVVVQPFVDEPAPAALAWLRADPGVRVAAQTSAGTAFDVRRADGRRCP